EKPDLVIGIFLKSTVFKTLELSKKYDTPIFMINTGIPQNERDIDYIRKKYSNFIGHMYPDEVYAGYILAKHLISVEKKKNTNKKIRVIGISGDRNSPVTHQRNLGLQKAVKEEKAILEQIVYANWSGDLAFNQAKGLISRYKDLDVIWTASDKMAINANNAIIKTNHESSIVTGGMDWTKDAIDKIKNKELEVSVGGHFSEIGFALVLIYDYFHGKDFYDELGGEISTKMSLLTRENINDYYEFLSKQDWDKIDFSKFSKVLNPEIKKYNFSFDELIKNYNLSK
ncbi:MAG: ABC transporter substrate-binding protein, partial [Campylobacteraceae bacterium]|nr:ABC transporter substrate-binding protein [Campylobacteraceae bacterium]